MIHRIEQDLVRKYSNKPHRLQHINGVRETAVYFGKQFNVDIEKLVIASLLHDITKYDDLTSQIKQITKFYPNSDEILQEFPQQLLHAFTARIYAEQQYNITDEEILNAITSHTIGRPNMSIYEEIIFLADYIEPTRTYMSCIETRELAHSNFTKAIYKAIDDSITHQEQQQNRVPAQAYLAKTYYKQKLEEQTWTK